MCFLYYPQQKALSAEETVAGMGLDNYSRKEKHTEHLVLAKAEAKAKWKLRSGGGRLLSIVGFPVH